MKRLLNDSANSLHRPVESKLHTCPRLFRRHRQQCGWDAAVGATALGNLSSEKFSVARKLTPVGTRFWSSRASGNREVLARNLT